MNLVLLCNCLGVAGTWLGTLTSTCPPNIADLGEPYCALGSWTQKTKNGHREGVSWML